MTSVVGFDIGNLQSKIGLARNRGIDIVTNETSNRATPSLVSFGPKSRATGEAAKTQETSNWKNTVSSIKRLIGRSYSDADIQDVESKFVSSELVDINGSVGVSVNYLGEKTNFTATQLYAMYLAKLRDTTSLEAKMTVNNVVIAVPGWYTDVQRRAVLDAAEIANLNPLRLINDGTAIAFGYGITKADLPAPEEKPRTVAFVDIGHSDYSVTIASFNKTGCTIKSAAYDRHFGGRNLDLALVEHFAKEFSTKYKMDVASNKKAIFRLTAACERLKKVLSANSAAPINVESLMNDIDASSSLTREDFEGLVASLLERTTVPLEAALQQSGLTRDDIDFIELVGGTTRVPAVKNKITEFFGRPLSTTLNQDEAVARGSTLACAVLSPVFRVRDFTVQDVNGYPIDVSWEKVPEDEDTSIRIFDKGNAFPSLKNLTLNRSAPFDVQARYASDAVLPGGINPDLARVTVKGVQAAANGQPTTVKVRSRLTLNGIFVFEGATAIEETGEEEEVPAAPAADGQTEQPVEKKRKVNKRELPVVQYDTGSLERGVLEELRGKEGEMYSNDKLVMETENSKNALEEYIYDVRDKLDSVFSSFATSEEKEKITSLARDSEDWLYSDEGDEASKSAYVEKLDSLKNMGGPIANRYKEAEERPAAIKKMRESLAKFSDRAASQEERFAHISEEDRQKALERIAVEDKWVNDNAAKQAEKTKSENPVFSAAEILKRREELVYYCNSIFNKAKPQNKSSPAPDANKPKEGEQQQQEQQQEQAQADTEMPASEEVPAPEDGNKNMDVD